MVRLARSVVGEPIVPINPCLFVSTNIMVGFLVVKPVRPMRVPLRGLKDNRIFKKERRIVFIVIEGADGCGKSVQAEMLLAKFKEYTLPVVGFSFPRYDTDMGKAINSHLKGEWKASLTSGEKAPEDSLVFQALQTMDKLEAATTIAWYLSTGAHVVSCRWWQSAVVYGAEMGFEAKRSIALHSLFPQANLNVLLTVPEEVTLARRPELRDHLEKDRNLQRRVRAAYQELWRQQAKLFFAAEPKSSDPVWVEIDGSASAEEVHRRIWILVLRLHFNRRSS
jgi:thymidylate kinase